MSEPRKEVTIQSGLTRPAALTLAGIALARAAGNVITLQCGRHPLRTELTALDDRVLQDIGITRAEAEFLNHKPCWRE